MESEFTDPLSLFQLTVLPLMKNEQVVFDMEHDAEIEYFLWESLKIRKLATCWMKNLNF